MRHLALGLGLTVAIGAGATIIWGRGAILPAGAFGLLATGIQLAAVRVLRPALGAPFRILVRRWAIGMGLRLMGVVLLAAGIATDPARFQPVPSALGYLGVLIPLLFTETRFLK